MADVPTASSQGESISPGFPLTAKLMLLCSPLFLSLPHCWRMLTLQNLSELRPDLRLADMLHYLTVEIAFSIVSIPVSMFADATIGLTASLMSFISISCLAPVCSSVAALPGFDFLTRVYMLKFGANFLGLGIILSVLERAFFVRLMHVNSPTFRLYCFLCYFLSIVWQVVNAIVLYTPKFFPLFYENNGQLMAWLQVVYQCALWSYMTVMYSVVARLKRPEVAAGYSSFKVIICMFFAIFYGLKMIWARLRWKTLPYKDVFEACEQLYPNDVVNSMRRTFRLFLVLMCLMYLFGMELILRTVWFHQDEELKRHPKPSLLAVFPMELGLLLYLVILYPIVNFLVLPFIKNKLHFRLSDLRLLGIALIFFNLSYLATMGLEWSVLSTVRYSPHTSNIAIRIYNCMLNPVTWTVKHPSQTNMVIFLPAWVSRMFVSDVKGSYQLLINSSVFNEATSLHMELGDSRVFIMRGDGLEHITAIEHQLSARPDFKGDDTHLFIISCLLNSTEEYLAKKRVEVSWRTENAPTNSTNITSDVTHIILKEATFDVTLKLGEKTFDISPLSMNDHGVYSIMFYDSSGGTDGGYAVETVSVGFVYSRRWANVQIILLAIGMAVGQIPMVHYTYKNAPSELVATCFSFHRCACAISTFFVYIVTANYGLGPGPSTFSTCVIVVFTVFFIFLSVSDIVPSDDDIIKTSQTLHEADDLSVNSGSLRFVKSMLAVGDPQPEHKSKTLFANRDSVASDEKEK